MEWLQFVIVLFFQKEMIKMSNYTINTLHPSIVLTFATHLEHKYPARALYRQKTSKHEHEFYLLFYTIFSECG